MKQKDWPRVRVLKVGTICLEASEFASTLTHQIKSDLGIGGGSTVTLIEAEQRILVDTGFDCEWLDTISNDERNIRDLTGALKDLGIRAEDIDVVFITHWHRDHYGNLEAFKDARRMASRPLLERFRLDGFTGLDDGEEIAEGVKVMLTPGHTAEHASVVVDSVLGGVKARVAIAGDAIVSHSYFQAGRIWQCNADFHDVGEAKESIRRLVTQSDIIIPGHGVPFTTSRPRLA